MARAQGARGVTEVCEDMRRLHGSVTRAVRSKASPATSREKSQMEGEALGALVFCVSAVCLFTPRTSMYHTGIM